MHGIRRSRRVATAMVALLLGAVALTACLPPPPPTTLEITASTSLFPNFDVAVTDYVARCGDGLPVTLTANAPNGMFVSVAWGAWAGGLSTWSVTRDADEMFTIDTWVPPAAPVTHVVRCLPADFPHWSATRSGDTAAPFVMTAPLTANQPARTMIFDHNGVPIWWSEPEASIYSTLLPDGNVGTLIGGGLEERSLDGSLVRTVATTGGPADPHDVLLLPNGHVVMVTIQPRPGVDLTAIGGPGSASVCDHVIQEIDPADGSVVWSWDTADHVPVTEMDPQWRAQYLDAGAADPACGYDVYHWNSIEPTASGYLLSFRHLDAVYSIDRTSGAIEWKLGAVNGSTDALAVVDDPVFAAGSHFGGQHDARVLPDGTVTLFDDGSNLGRSPRAVRYSIDTGTRTATLVESVTDPGVTASFCCGSARRVETGDWLIGWGGTGTVTEAVAGTQRFALDFPGGPIVYRAIPLDAGQVTRDQLIAAMDTRAATSGVQATDEGVGPTPFPP